MAPALVLGRWKSDVQERPPLRPFRFSDQSHVSFSRQAITFPGIARDTGTNDVFPRRSPSAIAWNYVVQVQIVSIEQMAAILTGVLVALENIVPGEFHFFFRQPIEHQKHDHPRNPDLPRDGGYHFMIRSGGRKITPAVEIVGQKIVRVVRGNDVGLSGVNEGERPASRADINGLPEAV